MISKNQIKFIHSLELKKFRKENGLFVAEGKKIVNEILNSSLKIHSLYATKNFKLPFTDFNFEFYETDEAELKKISFLSTSNHVLCLVEIPQYEINFKDVAEKISIFLENIQDPGNLGNILRIADWFGISTVFCSPECVDAYNPKVVQASMGSIARVKIHCGEAEKIISEIKKFNVSFPVYATVLDGKNIYRESLNKNGLLIFGKESEGISKETLQLAEHKIFIPRFGNADSLNVAASAAIICSEFMRREYDKVRFGIFHK